MTLAADSASYFQSEEVLVILQNIAQVARGSLAMRLSIDIFLTSEYQAMKKIGAKLFHVDFKKIHRRGRRKEKDKTTEFFSVTSVWLRSQWSVEAYFDNL